MPLRFFSKFCAIGTITLCGLFTRNNSPRTSMKHVASELKLSRAANGYTLTSMPNNNNNNINDDDDDDDDDDISNLNTCLNEDSVILNPSRIEPKYRCILAVLSLAIVMVIENFFIWVVSHANEASHAPPYPAALQDNGRLI